MMMFLPRALVSLRAGVAQAPVELEQVARSLGRGPAQAIWSITLQLAAPGAAAGAAMVFLGIVNELTATLLLAPNGTETLATSFWALSGELNYAAAAPYATMMVALSLPLTWLLYHQSRRLSDDERTRAFKSLEVLWLGSGGGGCGSHRAGWRANRHPGTLRLGHLIAWFEQPSSGGILLDGQMIANETGIVPVDLRRIGYLPQDGGSFPHLSVADNISFGVQGRSAQRSKRAAELMEMVALDPAIGSRSPHELSGGQQQRVALARAVSQRPRLMLLHEPFSALDTGLRAATRQTIGDLLTQVGVKLTRFGGHP
jgi:ABC-type uncharacterized transport system YnjBCD ATPase subunit